MIRFASGDAGILAGGVFSRHRPAFCASERGGWSILVSLLFAMAAFDAAKSWVSYRFAGEAFPGWGYVAFEAAPWLAWLPLVPILLITVRLAPVERIKPWVSLGLYGTLAIALATVQSLITAAFRSSIAPSPPYDRFMTQFTWLFPEFLPLGMAVFGALLLGVLAMDYRNRWMGQRDDAPDVPAASSGQWVSRLTVRSRDRIHFVPTESVDWIRADGNYVRVRAGEDEYRIRGTLTRTLSTLDPSSFVRIHRSTVVNVQKIREIQPWFSGDFLAILESGENLKVSRRYRSELF